MKKLLHGLWITDHGLRILLLTAFCSLLTVNSFASVTNITSGGPLFSTLSNAIYNANYTDTLLVTTGVYYETENIYSKMLIIDGRYGDDFVKKIVGGKTVISAPETAFSHSGSTFDITNSAVELIDLEITEGGFKTGTSGDGGGLDIHENSQVILYKCKVYTNFAYGNGGGIYVEDSSLLISNSIIFANSSRKGSFIIGDNGCGGGIYAHNSSVMINNTAKIYDNYAFDKGGGVRSSGSDIIVDGSVIYGNTAKSGGGVAAEVSSLYEQKNLSLLYNNTSTLKGGGILIEDNSTGIIANSSVVGWPFSLGGNIVTNGNGGGIYVDNSNLILTNLANIAHNYSKYNGGGIYITNSSLFSYSAKIGGTDGSYTNKASQGGGIFAADSILYFTNSFVKHGYAFQAGGGIYAQNSKIYSCDIYDNKSHFGGGINLAFNSSLFNSKVYDNSGGYGGGVYCYYTGNVYNTTINNNYVFSHGGGIHFLFGGLASNCYIESNIADSFGGGAYISDKGSLFSCIINSNYALNNAGGIYLSHGGTVVNCNVSSNTAGWAGGVYLDNNGGSVSESIISENSAVISGGGIYLFNGGAVTNCLIKENTAMEGGGAIVKYAGALYNCTIVDNNADAIGGGILCTNGGTVVNTIIYNNQAFSGGNNWMTYPSNVVFNYCCTTPTNGLPSGNQCIPDNPMFVAPGFDYTLQDGSPCIDVGYKMDWMDPPATDLAGNPRLHDGQVDMGCYEFIPEGGMVLSILCSVFSIFIYRRKFNL